MLAVKLVCSRVEAEFVVLAGGEELTVVEAEFVVLAGGEELTVVEAEFVVLAGGEELTVVEAEFVVLAGGEELTVVEVEFVVLAGGEELTVVEAEFVVLAGGEELTVVEAEFVVLAGGEELVLDFGFLVVDARSKSITSPVSCDRTCRFCASRPNVSTNQSTRCVVVFSWSSFRFLCRSPTSSILRPTLARALRCGTSCSLFPWLSTVA